MMILEFKPETSHSNTSQTSTVIEEAENPFEVMWIRGNGPTKRASSPLSDYDGVLLSSPASARSHISVRTSSPAPAVDSKKQPQPSPSAPTERSSTMYQPLSVHRMELYNIFDERHIPSATAPMNRKFSASTLKSSAEFPTISFRSDLTKPDLSPSPDDQTITPPTPRVPVDMRSESLPSHTSTPQFSAPSTPVATVDVRSESPASRMSTPQSLLTENHESECTPTPILLSPVSSLPPSHGDGVGSPRVLSSPSSSPVSVTPIATPSPNPSSRYRSPRAANLPIYIPPSEVSPLPGLQNLRSPLYPARRHTLPPASLETSTDSFLPQILTPPQFAAFSPYSPTLPPPVPKTKPRQSIYPPYAPPAPKFTPHRRSSAPWAASYPWVPTPEPLLSSSYLRAPTPVPNPAIPPWTWRHDPIPPPMPPPMPPPIWNSPVRPFIPPVIPQTPGESTVSFPPFHPDARTPTGLNLPSIFPDSAKRHHRYFFEDGSFTIQVKDTLYKIHEYFIQQHAPSLWSPSAVRPRVNHISGVEPHQFELVLSLFYPRNLLQHDPKTTADWSSVLHVAHTCNMSQIRTLAISQLEDLAEPAEKIELANKYGVREWLFDAYMELSLRMEGLSVQEASKIGPEGTLLIADMKEQVARGVRKFVEGPETARTPAWSRF